MKRLMNATSRILRRLAPANPELEAFGRGKLSLRECRSAEATEEETPASPAPGRLESHFDRNREGPGIWKWRHYFEIYERHFGRFVGRPVRVLEIGVYSGGSLSMWREYFGRESRIVGVDIEAACQVYAGEGIQIVIGDQGDRGFWREFCRTTEPFDVVIDDGSHVPEHQRVTFEGIYDHIRPGGVYLCEDILGSSNHFGAFVAGLSQQLHHFERIEEDEQDVENRLAFDASSLQRVTHSLHLYPLVAVVEKRSRPLDRFVAPMHGSSWQPSSFYRR